MEKNKSGERKEVKEESKKKAVHRGSNIEYKHRKTRYLGS